MSEISAPRTHTVTTPDSLAISVREWGNPSGRPVLFIHGYAQAGLCWSRQVGDPALQHLRLVTYDLRGHGASDKPPEPHFYQEGWRWGEEVHAILTQLGLERPVLAGWSYGGRIIGDYLLQHGGAALSGVMFVDAITENARHFYGSCNRLMKLMTDPDPATCIEATRAFIRACFLHAPDTDLYETLLAAAMMCPPAVRAAMARPAEYAAALAALDLPVRVVHGAEDHVIAPAMAVHIAQTVQGARLEMFEDAGHAPFLESPARFNAVLAELAAS